MKCACVKLSSNITSKYCPIVFRPCDEQNTAGAVTQANDFARVILLRTSLHSALRSNQETKKGL